MQQTDLFLPELYFIDHLADAFPGALMPQQLQPLIWRGEQITPLVPLQAYLLDRFTPEQLSSAVYFQPIFGDEAGVRVILALPNISQRWTQDYVLKEENAFDGVPVLEVYPNIRCAGWQEYYGFYYDAALGKDTFRVEFPNNLEAARFTDQLGGSYQTVRMGAFPTAIQCQNLDCIPVGLILLQQPRETRIDKQWTVGIDLGDASTNVYIQKRPSVVEPLPLKPLHLKVTQSPVDTRFPTLFEYFIPENFLPLEKPLPIRNVLTTEGASGLSRHSRLILDGRIYIPTSRKFNLRSDSIYTDIRVGGDRPSTELFLKQLALQISAIAVSNEVKQIQWSFSYPTTASIVERDVHLRLWQEIIQDLQSKTGIEHSCPEDSSSDRFCSGNFAFAQYFADEEHHDLIYSTCLKIETALSEVSIWEDNKLIHQCNLQFAEQNLLFQFLEQNPHFLERQFGINISEWQGLQRDVFNTKLETLLDWETEEWLRRTRPTLIYTPEVQGLVQLMAIGLAGLYYYIGLLLRVLNDTGQYQRQELTPVYLGGKGSRVLHWLDYTGRFSRNSEINGLLSRMLSRGAGFRDTSEQTRLSQQPSDEVACGLVLSSMPNSTKLRKPTQKTKDVIILGETCKLNGQTMGWNTCVDSNETVQSFHVSRVEQFSSFLADFHIALEELQIEGIRPLHPDRQSWEFSDSDLLWRGICQTTNHQIQNQLAIDRADRWRLEPAFILVLKGMLHYLGQQWAEQYRAH